MRLLLLLGLVLATSGSATASSLDPRADSLLASAIRHHNQARLAEAESLAVIGIAVAEQSGDSLTLARLYARRVLIRCGRGMARDPDTETYARSSIRLYRQTLGPDHAEYAYGLGVYGRMLRMSARLDDAEPVLELAAAKLDSIRNATGEVHEPGPFQDLAMLNGTRGNWDQCIAYYQRTIADFTQRLGAGHSVTLIQTMNLGLAYSNVGKYDSSRVALETALEGLRRLPAERPDARASAMVNLGSLLYQLGELAQSRALHREAVPLQESVLGADHPNLSVTLGNLASIHLEFGDLDEARDAAERAAAIAEARFAANDHRLGMALETLAEVYFEAGEYQRAADLAERALRIREAAQGSDHEELISSLTLVAKSLERLGQTDRAQERYQRILDLAERRLKPTDVRLAMALSDCGAFQRRRRAPQAAGDLLDRAVAAFERGGNAVHPRLAEALAERGALRLQIGSAEGALADALRAEGLSRDHFRRTIAALPENVALKFAASRPRGLGTAIAAATALESRSTTAATDAFDALVRSRALVLDEVAGRRRTALINDSPRENEVEDLLAEARARMAHLFVAWSRNGGEESRKAYQLAEREVCELEDEALEQGRDGSPCALNEAPTAGPGLADVRAALATGDAMVSFSRYAFDDSIRYAAFVARRDRVHVVALGSERSIEVACRAWLEEISRDPRAVAPAAGVDRASRELGVKARQRIWDPLASRLEGVERVLIVPDGILSFIPFAALPGGKDGYLVEIGPTLHYLSAERDLIRDQITRRQGGMLALGGPDYDARPKSPSDDLVAGVQAATVDVGRDQNAWFASNHRSSRSECEAVRSLRFEALPGTRREAMRVAEVWGQGRPGESPTVRLGESASESAFKREAAGQSVIHLATHAFVVGEACQDRVEGTRAVGWLVEPGASAKQNVTPKPVAAMAQPSRRESPLRLVGLALAGANRRDRANAADDDGVLTADEVAGLDLSACEWAVLSSCHSGIGEYYPDEGLLGLRRAFVVAGARTLIASLWAVGDESTLAWMPELYRARFTRGEPTDMAMRSASRAVLASRRAAGQSTHPFYWAAFVAVGDPGGR